MKHENNKTYGTLTLEKEEGHDFYAVVAEPHVLLRLKNLYPRINKASHGKVRLKATPETSRDLEWFMDRFPLTMDAQVGRSVRQGAAVHRRVEEQTHSILRAEYAPREHILEKPLRHYQSVAVDLLLSRGNLLLGDEVGLGKTVSAIGTFTDRRTLPALVVCQTHLCQQWRDDFLAKFMPLATVHIIRNGPIYALPDADIYIISYSKLSKWGDVLSTGYIHSVTFDEAQELRHPDTAKHSAAVAIRGACKFAMGLSGTPVYNYGGEIYSLVDLLEPGRLGTREEFYREWCQNGGDKHVLDDPTALGTYLRSEGILLRRHREDVGIELPQVTTMVQPIPYSADVLASLQDTAVELARMVLEGDFLESGEAARAFDMRLRQASGIAKAPFVAEFVRLLTADGQKVLLSAWHREFYNVVAEKFGTDVQSVYFTGEETTKQKRDSVEAFTRGSANVFVVSNRSGTGLDGLQTVCSTVVIGELDWSPGVHEQIIGRIKRPGQTKPVMVFFPVINAGSDPVIADLLQLKNSQFAQMFDPDRQFDLGSPQVARDRIKQLARGYLQQVKTGKFA